MTDDTLQHVKLAGSAQYIEALDTICSLAKHRLFIFEKDYVDIGFNSEARYEVLRNLLLSNPNNRLHLLAHDTRPISQYSPRIMTLLRQFGHNMLIYQTPKHMQHLTEPYAIADAAHHTRRFHFDDTRGILALNDHEGSRLLASRFNEVWQSSHPSAATSSFTL